jgi:hypothetical protein
METGVCDRREGDLVFLITHLKLKLPELPHN